MALIISLLYTAIDHFSSIFEIYYGLKVKIDKGRYSRERGLYGEICGKGSLSAQKKVFLLYRIVF
jgi:hypothetical protein